MLSSLNSNKLFFFVHKNWHQYRAGTHKISRFMRALKATSIYATFSRQQNIKLTISILAIQKYCIFRVPQFFPISASACTSTTSLLSRFRKCTNNDNKTVFSVNNTKSKHLVLLCVVYHIGPDKNKTT